MTIYDISKKSGVSIATVSRVINNKKGVSEATRQRVLAVMAEKGYVPNAIARGLGLNSMKTVGILCMDVADIYLAQAVSTLERELRRQNYDSLLCCTGGELENKKGYLNILLSKRVDAIILVGSHFLTGDTAYIENAAKQVPILLINGYVKAKNVYCIVCDDFGSVRDAVDSLLQKGRRHILYAYDTTTYSGRQKLDGYRFALASAGIAIDERMILHCCSKGMNSMRQEFDQLFEAQIPIDAVVTSEDVLAVSAVKSALAHGRLIPSDLEVIGYNNSILARCCEPELTSVDSRVEALCMTAISTLFGVIAGKDFPDKTTLSGELVKRFSTKI